MFLEGRGRGVLVFDSMSKTGEISMTHIFRGQGVLIFDPMSKTGEISKYYIFGGRGHLSYISRRKA